MKIVSTPIEHTTFIADPNSPTRPLAWHLVVAEYLDTEDGSPMRQIGTRVMTQEAARAAGLDIPQVVAAFDTVAAKANVALSSGLEEAKRDAETKQAEAAAALNDLQKQHDDLQVSARGVIAENAELSKRVQIAEEVAAQAEAALVAAFGEPATAE